MNADYKIYADAGRPATLNNGTGIATDCATLQVAVLAWRRLAPEQKIRATVKVIGGPVYTAQEIERLRYVTARRLPPPRTGGVCRRPIIGIVVLREHLAPGGSVLGE